MITRRNFAQFMASAITISVLPANLKPRWLCFKFSTMRFYVIKDAAPFRTGIDHLEGETVTVLAA